MKSSKPKTFGEDAARLPMAAPGMRIGLLGGSFDPPHAAHRQISATALKRLGLDRVWWLVTPGNPLKPSSKADLESRVEAARKVARHSRVEVTGFSAGSAYTIDLLAALKRRFPGVNFVWLMGADSLAEFHRWRAWEKIFALMPIAVLDRPGFRLRARASKAAQRFAPYMVDESDAGGLPLLIPPAWTILTHRLSPLSSTSIRAKKAKQKKGKKAKAGGKQTNVAKKGKTRANGKRTKGKTAKGSAKGESRSKARKQVKRKAKRH